MERNVCFDLAGGTLVARLSGELDHHAAKPMREAIDAQMILDSPKVLRLDFSGVPFMDSSGIGLILGRSEICRKRGCSLVIGGLSGEIGRLIHLSGVEKIPCITIAAEEKEGKENETNDQ